MNKFCYLFYILFIALTFACPLQAKDKEYQYDLAALLLFQDEAPYLKEWLEYHKLLGVQHFYLYNNLSQDNFEEILAPYIQNKEVELIEWPYETNSVSEYIKMQNNCYNHCLKQAKETAKWLAVIDSDEFIVPVNEDHLVTFLKKYEKNEIGGICAHWVMFGTSFVEKIPDDKLMVETLILNGGSGTKLFKSIVRTKYTKKCLNAHMFEYEENFKGMMLSQDVININHYWSRDLYYLYNVKIPRRIKWGTPQEVCEEWESHANSYTRFSEIILRFVPELRERMGLPKGN